MTESLLRLLRCPFCGTRLQLVGNNALIRHGDRIESGVLGCECCAFPIVAGIAVLIADERTRNAMHALEADRRDQALCLLLGMDATQAHRCRKLLAPDTVISFRDAIELLGPTAEGIYFLHRFSDPTFVPAEALVRAMVQNKATGTGPRLDLCGGAGHLTRVLTTAQPTGSTTPATIIADVHFWKLWLATQFTVPDSAGVCCSAESPLPFVSDLFSIVILMDAFPYIWHKRLCADEMMRVARLDGVLALPHLHSSLGENVNSGDPLSPTAYLELFAQYQPRLFSDERLLDEVIEDQVVDLSPVQSPEQLGSEPSLTLVASRHPELYRRLPVPDEAKVMGELKVNPLYVVEQRAGRSVLRLSFPTPDYEVEFGACRRYLPDTVTVDADLSRHISPTQFGARYTELRRRRVLIDVPPRYW